MKRSYELTVAIMAVFNAGYRSITLCIRAGKRH